MNEEQKRILKMVETGQISAKEGAELLSLVTDDQEESSGPPSQDQQTPTAKESQERDELRAQAQPFWLIVLFAGLLSLLLGGSIVTAMYAQGRVDGWTWLCGWLPLSVGLMVVTLAAWSRTAPWIHVRVMDRDDDITISLPLPLGLTAIALRIARLFYPRLRNSGIDEAMTVLGDGLRDGQPLTIEVNDEDGGDHVQIYIG